MASNPLTGLEKAAVLLKSLPAPAVDKILARMDAKHADMLRTAIAGLDKRPDLSEVQSRVLDETISALNNVGKKKALQAYAPEPEAPPKPATPARVPAPAPVPASSVDIRIEEPTTPAPRNDDAFVHLAATPPDIVAQSLQSESAKTISLLMNSLDIEVAGNIYKRLDPAKRKEVSMQFTATTTISPDVLQRIAQAVLRKCQTLRQSSRGTVAEPGEREKRMATLLRSLDRTERMETVAMLESSDAELAARVKELLYCFDDILRMENTSVRKLLTEVETRVLAVALVGAAAEIQEKIYANLSKRAQESLREEVELAGKVPKSKVAEAQKQVVESLQRLDQRGELAMIES